MRERQRYRGCVGTRRWAVAVILLGVMASGCLNDGPESVPPQTNVIMVVVDTLRADRLASYGHSHDTAPFLSELAAQGVVFERAYSASSWTSSATASILTSTYPNQHQVLTGYFLARRTATRDFKPNRIPDSLPTLPETLRRSGYRNFAVADNLNVCEAMGFDRGFDHFVSFEYEGAPAVNAAVEAVAEQIVSGESPYFLYLHYMEPHAPYHRRRAYYDEAASGGPLFAAYDSEIGFFDRHLREVFELLEVGPDTLVIITSDHGEEFFEHGHDGHRIKLYDELLHVPLVISWPGRMEPRRVAPNVSTIDLVPTILDLLGIPRLGHEVGQSLVDVMEGAADQNRTLFAMRWQEVREPQLMRKAVISGHWKYIWSVPGDRRELYDRALDPGEQEDLAATHVDIVEDLHEQLMQFEETATVYDRTFGETRTLDTETVEKLRSLGYVD